MRGRQSKASFSLALLVGVFLAVVMAFASPPHPGMVTASLSRILLAFLLPQIALSVRERRRRRRRSDHPSAAAATRRRPAHTRRR
jgi:hypothetical protein